MISLDPDKGFWCTILCNAGCAAICAAACAGTGGIGSVIAAAGGAAAEAALSL